MGTWSSCNRSSISRDCRENAVYPKIAGWRRTYSERDEPDDTIRVLLADDHPALRAGIQTILERALDIQVVGEAKDGTEVQQLTADLRPQMLLLDQALPGPRPAETVAWVRAHCPETAVLVLTAHDVDVCLVAMVEARVAGSTRLP